ncbi:MAG TPA: hypothetical protein VFX60_00305, partial [Micromonospora sp.]|nr:hypothetical protein [Micromonospora sp.]
MRRLTALVGMSLVLALAACAEPGSQDQPAGSPGDPASEAFERRAAEIAEAWRNAPGRDAWHKGYVPLQEATVLPADPGFDDAAKLAFSAGWYQTKVSLPADKPADGTIRFPDGGLDVPLISAAEAYGQLAQGDPPSCPPAAAPTSSPSAAARPGNPDSSIGTGVGPCRALTVTKVTLDAVAVRTSRGEAQVPAWLFTVAGLTGPIARLAVAPSAVASVPEAPPPAEGLPEGLVSVQDLTGVDGATLSYRLGVGACDFDITPLV